MSGGRCVMAGDRYRVASNSLSQSLSLSKHLGSRIWPLATASSCDASCRLPRLVRVGKRVCRQIELPQRGTIVKPRVARHELPWDSNANPTNPNGVASISSQSPLPPSFLVFVLVLVLILVFVRSSIPERVLGRSRAGWLPTGAYPNLPVMYSSVCFSPGLVKIFSVSLYSISLPR